MLARLILALALALGAVPSMAAEPCHDAPACGMPVARLDAGSGRALPERAGSPARHRPTPVAAHACIGCIPPGDWRGAAIAARVPGPALLSPGEDARLTLGPAAPPTAPPPRIA